MTLQEATGLPTGDVGRGIQAVHDGGFVTGSGDRDMGTPPGVLQLHGIRLAPAGRVRVKQWPGEDSAAALLEVLDEMAERTDDPNQQSALRQTRTTLRGLPQKVLTELAIGYAKRVSGLDG